MMTNKSYEAFRSHPAITLFENLLVASPSGREDKLARIVSKHLKQLGYTPEIDDARNILVRIPGQVEDGPLCCLAAHLDEIGMVVTRIGESGWLEVDRSGGLYPWKLGEGPVELLGDFEHVTGVLSMGSTHTADAENMGITWRQCRVITGLAPEELEAAGVRPGTPAVPIRGQRGPVLFGPGNDPLLGAWTLDDRMGVVALLRLLDAIKEKKIRPLNPLLVAFTVHEEGGGNGAKVLAHRVKPVHFIAVDGAPMPPGSGLKLDGSPAAWSKDRLAVYDFELIMRLKRAAQNVGTNLQTPVYQQAASDASLVYYSGGAPRIACFGHVRENSHGFEVSRLSVFDNVLNTLVEFIQLEGSSGQGS